ncbi:DUF4166 domain-containing protein [Seohaeicola saemankumensis]|nr:DUF4166 domain-containing protein [Seohaeicola saemankumensis]MCA0871091.1 DUF4166 domain-containing protein [Seohaeicola saemankumensis]
MNPVDARCLGPKLNDLDAELSTVHGGYGRFQGQIAVDAPARFPLRQICRLMGFPEATEGAAFQFSTERGHIADIWTRQIGDQFMRSQLWVTGDGYLAEKLGPVTAVSAIQIKDGALCLRLRRMRVLGIPVPLVLAPRVETIERGQDGLYIFDVSIRLPLARAPLVRYAGFLAVSFSVSA